MKHLTQHLLTLLFCICLPIALHAQADDSKYLEGAVPEVEGKVIFTKEFSIPGMSQEEIYTRALNWMQEDLKKNENNSRVVYSDPKDGIIVGSGDEWIVFSSSALSLDRTKITYQLTVTCQPEKCKLEVEKVRYSYREGKEKYTAEEWITDKYALNKAKTKLVRGLAKWRRKTVDFVDNLCLSMAEALSSATIKAPAEKEKVEEKKAEKSVINSGPMVITQKKQVTIDAEETTPVQNSKVVIKATPLTPAQSVDQPTSSVTASQVQGYKEITPEQLLANDPIHSSKGKLVIVMGADAFNMTTMTANSGGSLGNVNGKPVVFTILSSDQPQEQFEKAKQYTVRFYPNGQTEPSVIMECQKDNSFKANGGIFMGEILKVMVKQ